MAWRCEVNANRMSTTTVRKLFRRQPAHTPEEIGARLLTLARKPHAKAKKGKGLRADETLYLAEKLGSHATRLRTPPSLDSAPAGSVFPNIQGE